MDPVGGAGPKEGPAVSKWKRRRRGPLVRERTCSPFIGRHRSNNCSNRRLPARLSSTRSGPGATTKMYEDTVASKLYAFVKILSASIDLIREIVDDFWYP